MDNSLSKKTHCEECGEELSTVSDFLKHISKHKSEEPPSETLAVARLYKNFKRFMRKYQLFSMDLAKIMISRHVTFKKEQMALDLMSLFVIRIMERSKLQVTAIIAC